MTLVADTGALYAAYDRADAHHHAVSACLRQLDERPVVSPLVLAELDHLVLVRLGERARRVVMTELTGAVTVTPFGHQAFVTAVGVAERYTGLALGLTDASLVVLAHEHGTRDILTTDQRHFRAVHPLVDVPAGAFRLLPFDA